MTNTNNNKTNAIVYFDMDGTLADFYGVDGWLDYIKAEDTTPYEVAKPLFKAEEMAKVINEWKNNGVEIGVITYVAFGATKEYTKAIRKAKKAWLKEHFPFATEVHIVTNRTKKYALRNKTKTCYLVDDEEKNLKNWANGVHVKATNGRTNLMDKLNELKFA